MNHKKTLLRQVMLYDIYGELLSEKRTEILDLYYNEDLSLSEIADEYGITRQGVMSAVQKSERILENFEEKLGLLTKFKTLSENMKELERLVKQLSDYAQGEVRAAGEDSPDELTRRITDRFAEMKALV